LKVTTSCSGRFHIFDQARQLYRHGLLHCLVNDSPKWITRRWGLPDEKVIALRLNGALSRLCRYSSSYLNGELQSSLARITHNVFSRRLAANLPEDSDVFIGLSSFCYDAIYKGKKAGIITIVDHGSVHQAIERQLVLEEGERWGFSMDKFLSPDWVIEKEQAEFEVAHCIFVLSQAAKRSLVEQGIDQSKIFVNPCGVDIEQFYQVEKPDTTFRVIQCGAIKPSKGVPYLIKAFLDLRLPNSELWFIGGGLEDSGLSPFINEHLADNIHFLGAVPQKQLPELYSRGSVFVLASLADGFGMVVSQAMACGLPVIVTENVGAADVVEEGVNGFVIPIRDTDSLKDKILQLYLDKELRVDMGRAARKRVCNGCSWDDYGDRLVNILNNIVTNQTAPSTVRLC